MIDIKDLFVVKSNCLLDSVQKHADMINNLVSEIKTEILKNDFVIETDNYNNNHKLQFRWTFDTDFLSREEYVKIAAESIINELINRFGNPVRLVNLVSPGALIDPDTFEPFLPFWAKVETF